MRPTSSLNLDSAIRACRLETNGISRFLEGQTLINSTVTIPERPIVKDSRGRFWLKGEDGAYIVEGGQSRRVPYHHDRSVESIRYTPDEKLWLLADDGAYRIEDDLRFRVELETTSSWWHRLIQLVAGSKERKIFIQGSYMPRVLV